MDAIDILGSLLGGKSSGGIGGKILKDMMGRSAPRSEPQRQPAPAPRSSPTSGRSGSNSHSPLGGSLSGSSVDASDLEDLLNVARNRPTTSPGTRASNPQAPSSYLPPKQPQPPVRSNPESPFSKSPSSTHNPFPTESAQRNNPFEPPAESPDRQSQLAWILIRAMLNAAKSDGQITSDEQEAILQKMGNLTQEMAQALREEIASPLDVREYAWSVPLGAEEQVYTLSLSAIDLDNQREAQYLSDLAHGLRLPPKKCNEIHQRLGKPTIFQ